MIDQIFTQRQILERTREHNIDTYHFFFDFRSAYDSIITVKLYQVMSELQIPPKIIGIVRATMTRVMCKVKVQENVRVPLKQTEE